MEKKTRYWNYLHYLGQKINYVVQQVQIFCVQEMDELEHKWWWME